MEWQNPQAFGRPMSDVEVSGRTALATTFLNRVFGWMAAGLAVSGAVAWAVIGSPALLQSVMATYWLWLIAQVVMVMVLSGLTHRMAPATAAATFLGYAALHGVTLGAILASYVQMRWHTPVSIANVFLVSSGTFAAMAAVGATTKRNLSGIGSFLMMGVLAILVAMVVNFFLHSSALDFAVSALGALIFTGLAAVDAQRFKAMGFLGFRTDREAGQMAIRGALQLYLDFINMFLFLLSLFSDRRR